MQTPDSLRAYVADGAIRRAASELLDLGDDGILEGLGWDELERFYRAQLAARQLISDWAVFAIPAWKGIWGGLLDHWTALTPDQQCNGGYDAELSLGSLRGTDDDSLWFGRIFTRGAWTFFAAVAALPSAGLRIKVSCESTNRGVRFQEIASGADDNGNWVPKLASPLDESRFDPAGLREIAKRCVEIADQTIAGGRAKPA